MHPVRSEWIDLRARDRTGDVIGVVVDVYDDPLTQRPALLAISTGFFGTRIAVAPLAAAWLLGDDVVVAHARHAITSAPHVDVVVTIDPIEQRSLVDHYAAIGRPGSAPTTAEESST